MRKGWGVWFAGESAVLFLVILHVARRWRDWGWRACRGEAGSGGATHLGKGEKRFMPLCIHGRDGEEEAVAVLEAELARRDGAEGDFSGDGDPLAIEVLRYGAGRDYEVVNPGSVRGRLPAHLDGIRCAAGGGKLRWRSGSAGQRGCGGDHDLRDPSCVAGGDKL